MKKHLICLFFAFSIFLIPNSVSASDTSIYITQGFTNINQFGSYEQQFLDTFVFPDNSFQIISNRSGVNSGVLSFDMSSMYNWGSVTLQNQSFYLYVNRNSRTSSVDYMPDYIDFYGNSLSLESQTFFVALPVGTYDFAYLHNFPTDFLNGSNGFLDQYSDYDIVFWGVANGNYDCRAKSFNTYYVVNSFESAYETVTLPFYSLDVDGFYDWIINNNKLSDLPSYIVQAKLKSFLEFYKQFGSSNTFFTSKIGDWFSHMNIGNQTLSNISALKSATDRLYQEYIDYRSGTHAYWPGATKLQERNDIDTITNNNNTILITDDNNDDIYTKLLRDILRGVISISNNIVQGCSDIVNKLEHLTFVNNIVNNGGDTDLSLLFDYDEQQFQSDWNTLEDTIQDDIDNKLGIVDSINQRSIMPENMLTDQNNASITIPMINGFTVSSDGASYETLTGSYTIDMSEHTTFDSVFKKIKRFTGVILIIAYLIRLRFRIGAIIRGES